MLYKVQVLTFESVDEILKVLLFMIMNKCFSFLYLLTLIYHNLEEFVLKDKEICESKTI